MTSRISTLQLSATIRTPERRRPAEGASLVATSSVEDELTVLKAEFFDEPASAIAVRSPIKELLDEEIELCWPLTKETEGPPGRELAEFKRFHYQVWKKFSSAEDLMTEKYLEILRRRDREALKRLVSKHLFDNTDTETKSKVQYALMEQVLANTTDASPILRQKLLHASPDYLSIMNIGLPDTPSTSRSLKRRLTTMGAEDAGIHNLETPTRPIKMRKLVETPQLAKQWERHDGTGIYPPSDGVVEWCIDTRKGGKYEHLACFTSASFPIKHPPATSSTKLLEPPITESQSSGRLLPAVVITDATALPSQQQRATVPTGPFTFSIETSAATATTTRPRCSRPSATAAHMSDSSLTLADSVKLRKRACVKRLL